MKSNIIFLLILLVTFSSCEKFTIEEPILEQSSPLTLSNYDGLNKATIGAYARLYSTGWYGANFILSSELRGGNAKNPVNSDFRSGRYQNESQWNFTEDITSPLWSPAYYVILQANNVINNVEGKETDKVTTEDLNNLKAQCLFLRSLAYFDLVRTYAQPYTYAPNSLGVAIVLEEDILALPSRNTVEEVYQQIVKDLLEAERIIEDDYKASNGEADAKAVVSKPAIQALLSRVYLNMGNWQKAADYATIVINNTAFKLWESDAYQNVWGLDVPGDNTEVIFEVYGHNNNSYYGSWDNITWITNPDGYADVATTADLRNLYEDTDVRGKMFVSHPQAENDFWTLKYSGKGQPNADANNIIVLRLSEMYLNRAEAIRRGAAVNGVSAADDLNEITSHRGASPYTLTPSLDEIFVERQKELCFEGHIVYDYARYNKSLVREDFDGVNNKDVPFPNYRWALPISRTEINANPNMEQNDNY